MKVDEIHFFKTLDCADILGRSKTQETNETDHKMLLNEDEKLNNKPVKILKTSGCSTIHCMVNVLYAFPWRVKSSRR